jgi:hypothetical protein
MDLPLATAVVRVLIPTQVVLAGELASRAIYLQFGWEFLT